MVRTLTKQEAIIEDSLYEQRVDKWYRSLSIDEKRIIHNVYCNIFTQIKCEHDFVTLNYYDQPIVVCKECGFKKGRLGKEDPILNNTSEFVK